MGVADEGELAELVEDEAGVGVGGEAGLEGLEGKEGASASDHSRDQGRIENRLGFLLVRETIVEEREWMRERDTCLLNK